MPYPLLSAGENCFAARVISMQPVNYRQHFLQVLARGGMIANLDVTVVCEAPQVSPHRDAMRERIAAIAGVSVSRVAIKATTSEKLGFTGRGEGIVAMATATVRLLWSAT